MNRAKFLAPLLLVLVLVLAACSGQTEVVTSTPGPTPEPIVKEVLVTPTLPASLQSLLRLPAPPFPRIKDTWSRKSATVYIG